MALTCFNHNLFLRTEWIRLKVHAGRWLLRLFVYPLEVYMWHGAPLRTALQIAREDLKLSWSWPICEQWPCSLVGAGKNVHLTSLLTSLYQASYIFLRFLTCYFHRLSTSVSLLSLLFDCYSLLLNLVTKVYIFPPIASNLVYAICYSLLHTSYTS